jgi:hypothetical protein
MGKADQPTVTFRITVLSPVKGVALCLQGKDGENLDVRMPTGKDLVFDVPARIAEGKDGWRFLGDHVRAEGKTRRFFYIAIGQGAGQRDTQWSRRAKIDFPEATPVLARKAAASDLVMEAAMQGAGADGSPACATIRLVSPWKASK